MNMKKLPISAALLTSLILPSGGAQAIMAEYVAGSDCVAANLNQAFKLKWDHYRIYNASNTPLWVTCPFPTFYKDDDGGYNSQSWIGTYHKTGATIRCILRRFSENQADNPVPFQQIYISAPPGASQFNPKAKRTNFNNPNMRGYGGKSMTCLLPPKTGIHNLSGWGN